MSEAIDTIERHGFTASIFYDEDAQSPAEWSRVGMLAYENGYASVNADNLPSSEYGGRFEDDCPMCGGDGEWYGEDHEGARTDDVHTCKLCKGECYVPDGASIATRLHGACFTIPVLAVDHGANGTSLRVADNWSDANGWIYATPESIAETLGADASPEQIRDAMVSELRDWEQWAQGDVYGVAVEDPAGDVVDSCWGFYGLDYARTEAERMLDDAIVFAHEQDALISRMMRE